MMNMTNLFFLDDRRGFSFFVHDEYFFHKCLLLAPRFFHFFDRKMYDRILRFTSTWVRSFEKNLYSIPAAGRLPAGGWSLSVYFLVFLYQQQESFWQCLSVCPGAVPGCLAVLLLVLFDRKTANRLIRSQDIIFFLCEP